MLLKCLLASNVIGGMLCITLSWLSILDAGVDVTAVAVSLLGVFGILFGGAELIYGKGD